VERQDYLENPDYQQNRGQNIFPHIGRLTSIYDRRLFFVADFLDRDDGFDADDLEARLVADAAFLLPPFLVEPFFFAPFFADPFFAAAFFAGAAFLPLELAPSPTNSAMRETMPFFFVVLFFAGRPC
jgi:hypothetical protein